MTIGKKNFDKRNIEWSLHRGEIKKSEYEAYLKNLPDDADNAQDTRPGDPDYENPIQLITID